MRIAVCCTLNVRGGAESALSRLLKILRDYGYRIDVIICTDEQHAVRDLIPEGVQVHYLHSDTWFSGMMSGLNWQATPRAFILIRRCIKAAAMLFGIRPSWWSDAYAMRHVTGLPQDAFDAVLGFTGPGISMTAASSLSAPLKAIWLHAHLRLGFAFRDLIPDFDTIFCVSHELKEAVDTKWPQYANKTQVLYNLIDADGIRQRATQYTPQWRDANDLHIVTVARLDKIKGLDIAIDAAALLRDRGLAFTWYVIGGGYYKKPLERRIHRLHLEDSFILCGDMANPMPYVKHADLYVQPSRSEGFGLAVQEALVLHKPVIATDIPAMSEQIEHGVTGVLCPLNPEAFAEAILSLASSPGRREKISEHLKTIAHSDEETVAQLMNYLHSSARSSAK
ncbi:glycosyltransferase [Bifidobacterium felsineum]|uniref:glycosyltransferase n=1 Tax=Bifidobacterium felsineum TaxID=2045440 RepID=UPI001BDD2977|nr:glycosyltransferase [Bifidobacterium felsineum]MBT1164792.1 glycosyltransferase [Bifidobacterium felsineum]